MDDMTAGRGDTERCTHLDVLQHVFARDCSTNGWHSTFGTAELLKGMLQGRRDA